MQMYCGVVALKQSRNEIANIVWNPGFRLSGLIRISDRKTYVKVTQQLMRHAKSRATLDIYTQGRMDPKRQTSPQVVKMIFTEEPSEILLQCRGTDQRLENIQNGVAL